MAVLAVLSMQVELVRADGDAAEVADANGATDLGSPPAELETAALAGVPYAMDGS
eukprot:SAG11_NODE_11481_length_758_cov_0.875569_1_plen_54_part_01